nr:MAG TPA: Protein of unknown function (DUF2911) [Caudoviricetes sp.]
MNLMKMDIQKISFLTYSRPSKDGRFLFVLL